jgi:hypothetical protein
MFAPTKARNTDVWKRRKTFSEGLIMKIMGSKLKLEVPVYPVSRAFSPSFYVQKLREQNKNIN